MQQRNGKSTSLVNGAFTFFIFKLEEEESTALLLHLLKLYAVDCFFASAAGLGCRLVVAVAQPGYATKKRAMSPVYLSVYEKVANWAEANSISSQNRHLTYCYNNSCSCSTAPTNH
jgi:hypothetical protein